MFLNPYTFMVIPYTRVNKRIRLFPKPQENIRLIPNMRLIMKGKNMTTPVKLACHYTEF